MKEVVLITGSGIIAQRLAKKLEKNNFLVRFLSRSKKNSNYYIWNIKNKIIEKGAFENVRHIIHLAGAGIADKRWSKKRKKEIISSRIDSVILIDKILKERKININTFISASAIGYYGTENTKNVYTESSLNGGDFLSDVCYKWENIVNLMNVSNTNCRIVKIRIGVVLSKQGGALEKMVKPIKYYFGASLGTGKQYMPWIHIDDLCSIFIYSMTNENIRGVYNAIAPEHIKNNKITKIIARKLNKPLFLPNIPSLILKIIFGEMSIILLKGSRVSSKKIINTGYDFKYKTISKAIEDLL